MHKHFSLAERIFFKGTQLFRGISSVRLWFYEWRVNTLNWADKHRTDNPLVYIPFISFISLQQIPLLNRQITLSLLQFTEFHLLPVLCFISYFCIFPLESEMKNEKKSWNWKISQANKKAIEYERFWIFTMNDSIDNLLKTTGATFDNREGYIGCQYSLFLTHGVGNKLTQKKTILI